MNGMFFLIYRESRHICIHFKPYFISNTLSYTASCINRMWQDTILIMHALWPWQDFDHACSVTLTHHYIVDNKHMKCHPKANFGLQCILSNYVPVQTIVSPYDANCVTPMVHWYIQLQILISFWDYCLVWLKILFFIFWNLHTTFL